MSWLSSNEEYREACRRSHRLLATYLAYWCWVRKVDCVAVPREPLMSHLGITKLTGARKTWLKEDLSQFFPYFKTLIYSGKDKFSTLYLSRKKYPTDAFGASMSDKARMALVKGKGLSAAIIKKLPSERSIVSTLARMVHGLQDFTSRP